MKGRRTAPEAFTLVEVVLALGVVSFCIVVLMGLFASGITSSRKSSEDTRLAALTWTVANEIHATNAFNYTSANGVFTPYNNWYDASGNFLTNGATAPIGAYFECQFTELDPAGLAVTNASSSSTPTIQMAKVITTYPVSGHAAPFTNTSYVLIPPVY